ncbi:hypothetical protein MNBD_ALPHA08-2108 [hydrothermal vent metagenome]|uniref:Glyoxalase-related protein domain-containing protein n=1 Tax=hydrothermal vent metagenome TaxID=652676 RepID=A0A3B0R1K4_9ZZZZ
MNRLPTNSKIDHMKQQARRLRLALAEQGNPVSHSKTLEMVALQHGYKDWNTLYAGLGNNSPDSPVSLGEQVKGRYLGQKFAGKVTGVQAMNTQARFRVTILFDDAVDVVSFDSFSSFRKRVTCIVDRTGRTFEKTSNGLPQLEFR